MKLLAALTVLMLVLSGCSTSVVRPDVGPEQPVTQELVPPVPETVPEPDPPAKVDPAVVEQPVAPRLAKAVPKPVVFQKVPVKKPVVQKPVIVKTEEAKPVVENPALKPPIRTIDTMAGLPAGAIKNLSLLAQMIGLKWSDMKRPSWLAGQIEQETCISLTHSKCFTSRAELKTSREWGVSFGQFTIAYDAKGNVRFNAFEEVKQLDKQLAQWRWSERYDERYGMMAFVVRMKSEFSLARGAKDFVSQHAFSLSAYNGGRGGVLQDRRLCVATAGCDQSQWYKHVERTSYKSRIAPKGYGQSFFQINRGYVENVQNKRSVKYQPFMLEVLKCQQPC